LEFFTLTKIYQIMGKRNRKPKKNREPITKSKIMAKVLPGFLIIIESKEHFISHLKSIFSKYKTEFNNQVQAHFKNTQSKPSKRANIDTFTRSDFHYHDQSGELLHIYKLQLENFIHFILETLRDIYYQNRQIMKACIKDSEAIIVNTLKETENLISGIFNETEQVSLAYVNLYKEKVLKDPIVLQFCVEENAIAEIRNLMSKSSEDGKEDREEREREKGKEKEKEREKEKEKERRVRDDRKRKIKEVVEDEAWKMDLEVEEFRKKLELEFINDMRERPNVTLDWIAGIKKKLIRA